jgi:hypothetical protein
MAKKKRTPNKKAKDDVFITLRVKREDRERYNKLAEGYNSLSRLIVDLLDAYEKQPAILNINYQHTEEVPNQELLDAIEERVRIQLYQESFIERMTSELVDRRQDIQTILGEK